MYKSLRRYSQIPFHCVCSKYLPEDCIKNLNANGIETIRLTESAIDIVNVSLPKAGIGLEHWNNTFDKLLIWGLTQFEKCVFLDSDMMVCANIDELFEKENMSAVSAGRFLYNNWTRLNSGCFVFNPDKKVLDSLLKAIGPTIKERTEQGASTGDQDVINFYYNDWPNKEKQHLSEKYNVFFRLIPQYLKKGLPNPKIVHFIGNKKPWMKKNILAEFLFVVKLFLKRKECLHYYISYKKLLYEVK